MGRSIGLSASSRLCLLLLCTSAPLQTPAYGQAAAGPLLPMLDSLVSVPPMAAPLDTIQLRTLVGSRADITNESYYEDAFVDTTFLGRRVVGTPEQRYAAVVAATVTGTRNGRETRYRLQTEVSVGNRLQRGYAGLHWRHRLGTEWTASWSPSLEYRDDRSFDRDLQEWRAAVAGRLRRGLRDDLTGLELGFRSDLLRSDGMGAAFLPDRQTAATGVALDHMGLLGDEWRVGYQLTGRVFPDSSDRDQFEHLYEARWKSTAERGRWLAVEATGTRRVTLRLAPTSRDNYWSASGAVEGRADVASQWEIGARFEADDTRYDVEDSTLYFNYQTVRGQLELRYEAGLGLAVALGPRAEALFSRLNPGEGYQELGGALDLEHVGLGAWWNVTPTAGWRDYDEVPAAPVASGHSSYAFYGVDLVADQALPLGFRFKVLGAFRWEFHLDPAQDARSVYTSVEISKALR